MSVSLWPHGLWPTRLLCPWDSLGKNPGVGYHFLLQGIFPTQESNRGHPRCRQTLYPLNHQGSPNYWKTGVEVSRKIVDLSSFLVLSASTSHIFMLSRFEPISLALLFCITELFPFSLLNTTSYPLEFFFPWSLLATSMWSSNLMNVL